MGRWLGVTVEPEPAGPPPEQKGFLAVEGKSVLLRVVFPVDIDSVMCQIL